MLWEEEDGDGGCDVELEPPGKKASIRQYPRHVNSALTLDKINFYRMHSTNWHKRHPKLPHKALVSLENGFARGVAIFPWLEGMVKSQCQTSLATATVAWNKMWMATHGSLSVQLDVMSQGLSQFDKTRTLEGLRAIRENRGLITSLKYKMGVMQVHQDIVNLAETQDSYGPFASNINWTLDKDLVLIEDFPGGAIIIPHLFLLSVLDKIEAYHSWHLVTTLLQYTPAFSAYPYKALSDDIYQILDQAYYSHGNVSLDICKALEPMMVGVILKELPSEYNSNEFLDNLRADFEESTPELLYIFDAIIFIVQNFLRTHTLKGAHCILDQFGQGKLHFNVITNPEEGMVKMYRYGNSFRLSTKDMPQKIGGEFIKRYICEYHVKEGNLPPIFYKEDYSPEIKEMLSQGYPGSLRYCNRIPYTEWNKIVFKPHKIFNYYVDAIEPAEDKAISPPTSYMDQIYAADALAEVGRRAPRFRKNQRLMLELLELGTVNTKEYFDTVNETGSIPYDWRLVQLMAKENELKRVARVFSILTFQCRLMASVREKNIAENILQYFPQQTMQHDGAQLRSKVELMAHLPHKPNHKWVIYNLDMDQWNYTFRPLVQTAILSSLDQIHGTTLYRDTLRVFQDAIFVSAERFHPPGSPNSFTTWTGHIGGNQGICQKLWTLITLLIIGMFMGDLDLPYELIGSGDNQVLAICFNMTDDLPDRIASAAETLKEYFEEAGLTLKLSETWYSDSLTCYQRKYHLLGRSCENAQKHAVRAFTTISDVDAGLQTAISTAVNGGININENTSDPVAGYIFSLFESFTYILGDPQFCKGKSQDPMWLTGLSLCTSDLGGLPFLPLTSYLYAAHKDSLTEVLALLNKIWDKHPEYRQVITANVISIPLTSSKEITQKIIMNPHAVNTSTPPTAELLLRRDVETFLRTSPLVKNQKLRNLFQLVDTAAQMSLCLELVKMTPLDLSIVHTLFEASQVGLVVKILNRFNRITSIVKLTKRNDISSSGFSFRTLVRDQDLLFWRKHTRIMARAVSPLLTFIEYMTLSCRKQFIDFCTKWEYNSSCTFALRMFWTSLSLGLLPERVTGPFCPAPLEQLSLKDKPCDSEIFHSIMVFPSPTLPSSIDEVNTSVGPFHIYVGSRTSARARSLKLTSLGGMDAGTALKVLLSIQSWIPTSDSQSQIVKFIQSQIHLIAPTAADLLTQVRKGVAGGNFYHRFSILGVNQGAYLNNLSQISTHYQLCTNLASDIQKGGMDYHLFFQPLFHYIFNMLRFCTPYHKNVQAVVLMNCCTYKVPDFNVSWVYEETNIPQSSVPSVTLTAEQERDLLKELEFHQTINSSQDLKGLTKSDVLSMVIAAQFAANLNRYQRGSSGMVWSSVTDHFYQNSYNITAIRLCKTETLIAAIGLQMIYQGILGPSFNPHLVFSRLDALICVDYTVQDVEPYRDILSALVTGGHAPEITIIGQNSPSPFVENAFLRLMKPFLCAVRACLINVLRREIIVPFSLSVKQHYTIGLRVRRFLITWGGLSKFCMAESKQFNNFEFLNRISPILKSIRIVVTDDLLQLEEHGRNLSEVDFTTLAPACQVVPLPLGSDPHLDHRIHMWISIPNVSLLQSRVTATEASSILRHHSKNLNQLRVSKTSEWFSGQAEILTHISTLSKTGFGVASSVGNVFLGGLLVKEACSNVKNIILIGDSNFTVEAELSHLWSLARIVSIRPLTLKEWPGSMVGVAHPAGLMWTCQHNVLGGVGTMPNPPYDNPSDEESWNHLRDMVNISQFDSCLLVWDSTGDPIKDSQTLEHLFKFLINNPIQYLLLDLKEGLVLHMLCGIINDLLGLNYMTGCYKFATSNLFDASLVLVCTLGDVELPEMSSGYLCSIFSSHQSAILRKSNKDFLGGIMSCNMLLVKGLECLYKSPLTGDGMIWIKNNPGTELLKMIQLVSSQLPQAGETDSHIERGMSHMSESIAHGSTCVIERIEHVLKAYRLSLIVMRDWILHPRAVERWDAFCKGMTTNMTTLAIALKEETDSVSKERLLQSVSHIGLISPSGLSMDSLISLLILETSANLLPASWRLAKLLQTFSYELWMLQAVREHLHGSPEIESWFKRECVIDLRLIWDGLIPQEHRNAYKLISRSPAGKLFMALVYPHLIDDPSSELKIFLDPLISTDLIGNSNIVCIYTNSREKKRLINQHLHQLRQHRFVTVLQGSSSMVFHNFIAQPDYI